MTDARGYITRNLTDIWGRTIQVIPPINPSVTYTHDTLDRLLTANYGGAVTTLTYDYAGRKLSMNDPDMGAWSYAYDALGNLTRQKDAKNQRICFYYDLLNRLTGKHYRTNDSCPNPPTLTTTYTYDTGSINGVGRRTRMDDSSGWTTWDYDLNGRVTRETKQINGAGTFVTRFGYNQDDSLAWMEYPVANPDDNIETVFYAYHPQGLMKNAYSDLYAYYYVQSSQYDAFGRTDLRKLGATNLVEQPKLLYNPTFYAATSQGGRLQNLKTGIPSDDDSLQSLTYTYDNVGNIQTIVDGLNSSQKQCFTYDSLNRLTKGTTYDTSTSCTIQSGVGTYHEEYQYSDTTGNLTSKTGVGSYTYTAGKHRVVTAGLGVSLGYDANGNMTTRTVFGNISTLIYNYENQLTTVSGATSGSFSYDGDGKRVKGTVGGVTTAYVGNYFEWTSAGSTAYYYAGGQRIAMRRAGYTSDNGLFWLLGDHLGSTTVTANSAGVRTAELRYKPWGQARTGVGTTRTSYRFTGQRSEESGIGLYWYNSRWYDALLGRFASPDSIIPQPYNPLAYDRYQYVNSNPVKYLDPSGNKPCDGNNQSVEECNDITINDLILTLRSGYRWFIYGRWWTKNDLYIVLDTGIDIEANISSLTNGNGRGWMLANMGGTAFIYDPVSNYVLDLLSEENSKILGMVPTRYPFILFARGGIDKKTIAQELAHIWDNNSGTGICASTWCGGGHADALAKFVGGNPSGIRWRNGSSGIPEGYQWDPQLSGYGYGNTATAEYFAEAFRWMIYDPNAIPGNNVMLWMQTLISLMGK